MNPSRAQRAESLLLDASRSHGIQVNEEDLRNALTNSELGPDLAEWALAHLGSDSLLSINELQIYSALDRSGRVDELADLYDLSEVQGVTEDELKAAIAELNRSTDAITKQTEVLQQQKAALDRLSKKQRDADARRAELMRTKSLRNETERREMTQQIEKLSQGISLHLSDIDQQGSHLHESVSTILQDDDRVLAGLADLGQGIEPPEPDETQAVDKIRETCIRLIKVTVESVRTRLDTIYLETLVDTERSGSAQPATGEAVTELQEELESLYEEIFPMAQMSVDQEYLGPALKSVNAKSGLKMERTNTMLAQVAKCLDHLLYRIEELQSRVEIYKAHQTACAVVASKAQEELEKVTNPVSTAQPTHRQSSRKETPLDALLQKLDISIPSRGRPTEKIEALAKTTDNRIRQYANVAKATQEGFEVIARTHLEDVSKAIQLLRDNVLAESPYTQVNLVDPEIQDSITFLTQEVDKVQSRLAAVDAQSRLPPSGKKDEIIRRWG